MLSLLHIENIAVIESADISFDRGFNVLTGETGAGKSIVIDAISAVHAKGLELDLDFATSVTSVPYHAGAAKYFAEQGITVPTK